MEDLEYGFSEEEIVDEFEVISDGDRTLNERMTASNAASFTGSFKAPPELAKETTKNVTFSKTLASETAKNSSLRSI